MTHEDEMQPLRHLLDQVRETMEADYENIRRDVAARQVQHAGHLAEAAWARFLEAWGPGWPIVQRKYVVGEEGRAGEIDILILRPDYPRQLHSLPGILRSGVSAAFSVKSTVRKNHLAEALSQKKKLNAVDPTMRDYGDFLCGPVPLVILAHKSALAAPRGTPKSRIPMPVTPVRAALDWASYNAMDTRVEHPRDLLDGIVVADTGMCQTRRWVQWIEEAEHNVPWSYHSDVGTQGESLALVHLIGWLEDRVYGGSALSSMREGGYGNAFPKEWPQAALETAHPITRMLRGERLIESY